MPYQPILYYIVTSEGLKYDSSLTNTINKRIYGKYYGYDDSEKNLLFPVAVYRPLEREWKRIRNARKLSLNAF
jgi:hypothetical protein